MATSWLGICLLCVMFSVCVFVCFYNYTVFQKSDAKILLKFATFTSER